MVHVKKVIEEVMTGVHKNRQLVSMGMGKYEPGKGFQFKPVSSFKLGYEAPQNQLEPIYYWILDFISGRFKVKKVTDNFTSSPGSGHFAEIGQRATRMQEEGMKIMGTLGQMIKSALNLVYDLKEFRMRLKHYDDYRSNDKMLKEGALLALKQVWLDSVDLPKRQTGSIHQMAAQLGYTTIREAFMIAENLEDVDRLGKDDEAGINQQVVRVVKPRLKEFFDWIEYSEKELRKRYSVEKSYLKSQVGSIKLYNAWAKPYFKAAEELRQKGFDGDAALVNAFSTSMFQLTLFATGEAEKSKKREYFPVMVIDFQYRGHLMQRATQRGDYAPAVSGIVDITFDSYSLNDEEIALINKKLEEADLKESLTLEGDYATEAIDELEEDLREFLGDDDVDKVMKKEPDKKKKNVDDINPFSTLLSLFTGETKKEEKKGDVLDAKKIKTDNWKEKQLRAITASGAADGLYAVYDIYKKAHGMASSPDNFDEGQIMDTGEMSTDFSEIWKPDWK